MVSRLAAPGIEGPDEIPAVFDGTGVRLFP